MIVENILINVSARLFISILFFWLLSMISYTDIDNSIAPFKRQGINYSNYCCMSHTHVASLTKYHDSNGYMKGLALSHRYVQLPHILRLVDNTTNTTQHKNVYNLIFFHKTLGNHISNLRALLCPITDERAFLCFTTNDKGFMTFHQRTGQYHGMVKHFMVSLLLI